MPLKTITTTTTRNIPNSADWFWVKINGGNWEPILVEDSCSTGWGLTVTRRSHSYQVDDDIFEWGPQIPTPEKIEETDAEIEKLVTELQRLESLHDTSGSMFS